MLPKMLGYLDNGRIHDNGHPIAKADTPEYAAELCHRWNAFEAMGEALKVAEHDFAEVLGILAIGGTPAVSAREEMSLATIRSALALYLRP